MAYESKSYRLYCRVPIRVFTTPAAHPTAVVGKSVKVVCVVDLQAYLL